MLEFKDDFGWIPDRIQAEEAKAEGTRSDRDFLLSMAKTFSDSHNVPEVWNFVDFAQNAQRLKDAEHPDWWNLTTTDGRKAADLLTPNQGSLPTCAGVSGTNAVQLAEILQNANRFGESEPQKFNPLGTWQMTKNGSRSGGQTISAMAEGLRSIGSCLESDLGKYSDRQNFRVLDDTALGNAAHHQAGVALWDDDELSRDDLCEMVFMLARKGFAGFFGCVNALADGIEKDRNGVPVLRLSGRKWAHAMACAGWMERNGTEYIAVINSHGSRYADSSRSFTLPDHCGFMDLETFRRMASGAWFDFCAITSAEGKQDFSAKPTLNPWRV